MTQYRLTITKFVPNPNYDKEMEEYENRNRYNRPNSEHPVSTLEEKLMYVTLDEKQYEAVKKAVLETFK